MKGPTPTPAVVRFWRHIVVDEITGCWLWVGARTPFGYGKLKVDREFRYTHDLTIQLHAPNRWPCPDGLEWCHRCPSGANPSCANPDHVFADTHSANVRESHGAIISKLTIKTAISAAAIQRRARSHCIHGHLLAGENLYIAPATGKRVCRKCQRIADKRHREKKAMTPLGAEEFVPWPGPLGTTLNAALMSGP